MSNRTNFVNVLIFDFYAAHKQMPSKIRMNKTFHDRMNRDRDAAAYMQFRSRFDTTLECYVGEWSYATIPIYFDQEIHSAEVVE